nr:hypothetical protein [Tanacetum cinerariifolium]
ETKLDREAGFGDVAGSGVESFRLSHAESFGVDDLALNLNKLIELIFFQMETQYELPVSEEPDVGTTREPIVVEVITQKPIVEEVTTQEPIMEDVIVEDYVSSKKDAEEDEENEIVEHDVDVHLFGIRINVPFIHIGVTNLVPGDVLEGEDVDVINVDGFDSDPRNDEETSNYTRRSVRVRARCDGKVPVFTMSQGTGPTGPNRRMEAGPSGSSGPSTRSK